MYLVPSGKDPNYVSACRCWRSDHGKEYKYTYLGKIIDKERNIYYSQDRGYFTFNFKTGSFGDVPDDFVFPETMGEGIFDHISVDFGDAFFIDSFLWKSGLMEVIDTLPFHNKDTLHAMICFYMVSTLANCDAMIWFSGSIAKLLYPRANLSSQRISEFLMAIGTRDNQVKFLQTYSKFILERYCPDKNILIDSSGLPNSIHMSETMVNVHNNKVSIETRLIFVVQRSTGLPLFYKSTPGNVVDVTTLKRVFSHLNAMEIDVDSCLIDAGYNSADNLDVFYDEQHNCTIGFITRADSSDKRYKQMIRENIDTIESRDNFVQFEDRYLFIVKKLIKVGRNEDNPAWMYLGLDCSRLNDEQRSLFKRARKKHLDSEEVYESMQGEGLFAIISGKEYDIDSILPAYYQRQQIEQTFDIVKNYTKILPLRVAEKATYDGHLLISFIASCAMKMIQLQLKTADLFLGSRLAALRNQKCTIYRSRIVTDDVQKEVNDVYKAFDITCPESIPLQAGQLLYKHPEEDPLLYANRPGAEKKGSSGGRKKGSKNKKTLEREAREAKEREARIAAGEPEPEKRGRGRPKGSKNKKTLEREAREAEERAARIAAGEPEPEKPGRGRRKGSKNKKTLEREAREAEEKAARIAAGESEPEKSGRGRRRGSKNKKTLERESREAEEAAARKAAGEPEPEKRGRGRPKGSKNKKTLEREAREASQSKATSSNKK